ncbi:MAG: 7TM diverse intracellular signaling domain-containing protein [Bermanella sp.]
MLFFYRAKNGMGEMVKTGNLTLIGILLVFFSCLSPASQVVEVDDLHSYNLTHQVEFLLDKDFTLDIHSARASQQWQNIAHDNINFGFINSALWLRFKIKTKQANHYILNIPYPLLDYLDHYSSINGIEQPTIYTGDARKFSSRAIDHIDFTFPYTLAADQVLSVYIRVNTQGSYEVPLGFSSKDIFLNENDNNTFIRGWGSGVIWLILFYNLFIYMAIRDRVYAFYVLNAFALLVASYAFDGSLFKLLWPNEPVINNYAFPIFNGLILATNLLFMMELLQLFKSQSWYRQYFLGLLFTTSTYPFLAVLLPYSTIMPIEVLSAILVNVSAVILGIHLSIKGDRTALYFTFSVGFFLIGLICNNLKSLGLLPTNFVTQHAYQLGYFIEMIVLSLALAQRIDKSRRENINSQKESIKNLRLYKNLYNNSVTGIFQVEKDGKLISVNSAFAQLVGFTSIQSLMKSTLAYNLSALTLNPEAPEKIVKLMQNKGSLVDFEEQIVHQDGNAIWVSLSMRPVKDNENNTEYYEGTLLDISERKENETLREQGLKDRMVSMEQLIVGICHELNTPLGSTMTAISHLRDLSTRLNDAYHQKLLTRNVFQDVVTQEMEALNLAEANLHRVGSLIRQFKLSSIHEFGFKMGEAFLINIIGSAVEEFHQRISDEKVMIDILCESDISISGYPQAISEIIKQLIDNSIDHAFCDIENKHITIKASLNEGTINLEYWDNGTGLSEQSKNELFNPFYTTMRGLNGKVGLGMYLTFNILTQLLNGQVELGDNTAEKGFYLKACFPRNISPKNIGNGNNNPKNINTNNTNR